jgi:hypothetical protein
MSRPRDGTLAEQMNRSGASRREKKWLRNAEPWFFAETSQGFRLPIWEERELLLWAIGASLAGQVADARWRVAIQMVRERIVDYQL